MGAMTAYSRAIAQSAETSEPEEPILYSTNLGELEQKEKQEALNKSDTSDDDMNALFSKAAKDTASVTNTNLNQLAKLLPGKLLGGDFVQLDS